MATNRKKTPRMWGWTGDTAVLAVDDVENPTYVGMDQQLRKQKTVIQRKPHVCGDGPLAEHGAVFMTTENPTYVGMDRR